MGHNLRPTPLLTIFLPPECKFLDLPLTTPEHNAPSPCPIRMQQTAGHVANLCDITVQDLKSWCDFIYTPCPLSRKNVPLHF